MKETLKKEIEGKFGSSVSGETSASDGVTGSLLSWKYSDYLRMFTVIGLITNEETMLLRMEDLIQKNMERAIRFLLYIQVNPSQKKVHLVWHPLMCIMRCRQGF